MKITLTRHTKDHQLRLSTKIIENFLERIPKKDDARNTVLSFAITCNLTARRPSRPRTWKEVYRE